MGFVLGNLLLALLGFLGMWGGWESVEAMQQGHQTLWMIPAVVEIITIGFIAWGFVSEERYVPLMAFFAVIPNAIGGIIALLIQLGLLANAHLVWVN